MLLWYHFIVYYPNLYLYLQLMYWLCRAMPGQLCPSRLWVFFCSVHVHDFLYLWFRFRFRDAKLTSGPLCLPGPLSHRMVGELGLASPQHWIQTLPVSTQ